jgi:hypothetical protein
MKSQIKLDELLIENNIGSNRRYQHISVWFFMILLCSIYASVIQNTLMNSAAFADINNNIGPKVKTKQSDMRLLLLSMNNVSGRDFNLSTTAFYNHTNHSSSGTLFSLSTTSFYDHINHSSSGTSPFTIYGDDYDYEDIYDDHDEIWNISDTIF